MSRGQFQTHSSYLVSSMWDPMSQPLLYRVDMTQQDLL